MANDKYRLGAGVMLVNAHRHVWVGRRIDNKDEAWQMPQGGIDKGEEPLEGALRELEEETGIAPSLVEQVEGCPCLDLKYDLPETLQPHLWGGKYVGQRQHWYLMRFTGSDEDVNIATEHPEFSHWKWVEPQLLPELIVPFKRDMYRAIVDQFSRWL
ncbi:RNA pyrophosphohydrolase [Sphingomicrobium clamense]|uniref:RNA pyrophosphohydrolase n=1 Tax=Sphingomicrobium clamense TaxID=2851013 RepID=A0ABS6V7H1_9SPHN|nr:RNA pyrophosphohydrolase [Sphingomicrobium sp. B8]MBW0145527.1 RNA pyrophosphohydrolase [Sphingomicrobium sp. B8]